VDGWELVKAADVKAGDELRVDEWEGWVGRVETAEIEIEPHSGKNAMLLSFSAWPLSIWYRLPTRLWVRRTGSGEVPGSTPIRLVADYDPVSFSVDVRSTKQRYLTREVDHGELDSSIRLHYPERRGAVRAGADLVLRPGVEVHRPLAARCSRLIQTPLVALAVLVGWIITGVLCVLPFVAGAVVVLWTGQAVIAAVATSALALVAWRFVRPAVRLAWELTTDACRGRF